MKEHEVRSFCDDRDNYNPGWKYNHWEIKGTPIRLELGKKDFEKEEVRLVRRDTGEKMQMKWADLTSEIPKMLEKIQVEMYERAKKTRDDHIIEATNWEEFMAGLNGKNLVLTPWCEVNACEVKTKDRSKEESLKAM